MAFEPIPVRRARGQVETQLREAILSGEFQEGEKLPAETELAERFAVSRTTTREALRTLAARGLITKTPGAGGGSFVSRVDHKALGLAVEESIEATLRFGNLDYAEINRVRRMLEVPSVRQAALMRTDADVEVLKENIEHQKNKEVTDTEAAYLDTTLHSAIAEASKNRLLASFVSALHKMLRQSLFLDLSAQDRSMFVGQHLDIVKAIIAGNELAAMDAMEAHLDHLDQLQVWHQKP